MLTLQHWATVKPIIVNIIFLLAQYHCFAPLIWHKNELLEVSLIRIFDFCMFACFRTVMVLNIALQTIENITLICMLEFPLWRDY